MAKETVKHYLRGLWWLWLLAGVVSIVFGLVATFWPGLTLVTAIQLAAFFVIVWGVFELIIGLAKAGSDHSWWLQSIVGIVMVGLGVFLVKNPSIGLVTFALIVGWVMVGRGLVDAIVGVYLDTPGKAWWYLSAILGVVAGIVLWFYPVSGSVAFMWVFGLYAIVNGTVIVSRALNAAVAYRQVTVKK